MNTDDRQGLELLRVEITGKLDLILARLDNAVAVTVDHESRLRRLESRKYLTGAQATLLASVVAAVAAVAVALIK